ncbi:hypothetical protein V5799_016338 [Amblyomma americanum]|uniref:CCHC-type domain-containing protein n=1 Tax=Amblyomma americanum TaxID=6943 RepID=A0AAQ4F6J8_AMBAM
METNAGTSASDENSVTATVPTTLVQQLLATTTKGTLLEREQLAAQVREILLTTSIDTSSTTAEQANEARPSASRASTMREAPGPLPKFIGYEDSQPPQTFLDRFVEYCDLGGIPNDRRLQLIPAALEGSAKQWWRFIGGHSDWASFAEDFKGEFAADDYREKLRAEQAERTQHSAENLKQFIHAIAEYYDRIGEPVTDAEEVDRVRRQMHPTFQDLTNNMEFANLRDMAKAAGLIMQRAWHRLRYVPPPLRSTQAASDLAFVDAGAPHRHCPVAAASADASSRHDWSLRPAAVLASRHEVRPSGSTLRAEAPLWALPDPRAQYQSPASTNESGRSAPGIAWPVPPPDAVVCHRCGGRGHRARACLERALARRTRAPSRRRNEVSPAPEKKDGLSGLQRDGRGQNSLYVAASDGRVAAGNSASSCWRSFATT